MKKSTPRVSDDDLRQAVSSNHTLSKVCLALNVRGGGSRMALKQRIVDLGLDTSHFTRKGIGKSRIHPSFICKNCGDIVLLKMYETPRVYCSPDCVIEGRPKGIKESLEDPERRQRISEASRKSWIGEGRDKRIQSMNSPEAREHRGDAVKRASQDPELRRKRSENAKAKWEADTVFREGFIAAATKARRERVLVETCARKPHVPHMTLTGGLVMMRSKWERDFALWLDRQNIVWEYEPERFVVEGRPYTPDFKVHFPDGMKYVELHRTDLGDSKIMKLRQITTILGLSILHIGESGIKEIRKHLRMQTVLEWSIPMQLIPGVR